MSLATEQIAFPYSKIGVKSDNENVEYLGAYAGDLYPGMCVTGCQTIDGTNLPATAITSPDVDVPDDGSTDPLAVVLNQHSVGATIFDKVPEGDNVQVLRPECNEAVLLMVVDSVQFSLGDRLCHNGDGTMRKADDSNDLATAHKAMCESELASNALVRLVLARVL